VTTRPDPDRLVALLVEWYRDLDGIADEMTYYQIDRQNERRQQLRDLGIEP
jgi:hypothetical protein